MSSRAAARWMRKGSSTASVEAASAAVHDHGAVEESWIDVVLSVESALDNTSVGMCWVSFGMESRMN
jgi:hypothetical protein